MPARPPGDHAASDRPLPPVPEPAPEGHSAAEADVRERFTAATVARRNADLVAGALEAGGLAHVRFDCPRSLREIIAIRDTDAAQARQALLAHEPVLTAAGRRAPQRLETALDGLGSDGRGPWRLYRPVQDPTGNLVLGASLGCELQVWASSTAEGAPAQHRDQATHVRAPRATPYGRWFRDDVFADAAHAWPPAAPAQTVDFPIDVVYTWVDDEDPAWAAQRDETLREMGQGGLHATSVSAARYRNRDELRYSLRSLELFAPFVRHVFIVTADQVPPWLDTACERVTVVGHREIFGDPSHLPTFNSHAIEANLHHIEGLSEQYLYLNDDVIFGRPVHPSLFFAPNGLHRFFLSRAKIPPGPAMAEDVGVDAAAKNGRDLLLGRLGRRVTQKFKHGPHAQRRSLVAEVEREFAEQVQATAASRFRNARDYSVPASLVHHYAYLQGAALPGELRYDFINLSELDRVERRFEELLVERDRDALCLNDSDVAPDEQERADTLLADFLERYLPVPSSFERA